MILSLQTISCFSRRSRLARISAYRASAVHRLGFHGPDDRRTPGGRVMDGLWTGHTLTIARSYATMDGWTGPRD